MTDALRHLGFEVDATRVGRLVDVDLDVTDPAAARTALGRMCEQLLANPLIETYEVVVHEQAASSDDVAATEGS